MSEPPDPTRNTVVWTVPGMAEVTVRSVEYAPGCRADVHLPGDVSGPRPAVVFVSGYADRAGRSLKDWGAYTSWGRLVAASGGVGVTYGCQAPLEDLPRLLTWLRTRPGGVEIDPARVGLWACSGNVPTALTALCRAAPGRIACAALSYPYTLGAPVIELAQAFRFAAPPPELSVADAPSDVPLLVVRAGRDEMPGLNAQLDGFIGAALARNLPLEVINHPSGPHAFDTVDATEASRRVVQQIVAFFERRLAFSRSARP